ncbi:MAG TPA: efflux RND transporter periplasmic adaptor subunit, partial [Polyangiaceae bacterium]|nr:efflux RND transporter periplasmic adaptor subunit [Polyangiaceae bacterium]
MRSATFETRAMTVLALAAASVAATGCRRAAADTRAQRQEPAIKVETATVSSRSVARVMTLTGTLMPNQKADVAADVSGKIRLSSVERGTFVPQGFPLAVVDARSAALSRTEASAEARALEAQSALAASECERAEKLFRDGALSNAEHDRQAAQCQASDWSSKAAQARANLAGKAFGDSTIRAPFAGLIAERF